MTSFPHDALFDTACAHSPTGNGAGRGPSLPPTVLVASNADGSFHYSRAFPGATTTTTADGHNNTVSGVTPDTPFWLASATKLLTSVAALQQVERGLIGLDDAGALAAVLPEMAGMEAVVESGGGVTLRHLLTHTSGLPHPYFSSLLSPTSSGPPDPSLLPLPQYLSLPDFPLAGGPTVPPGRTWRYGAGVDWAGLMVERLSGARDLGEYIQENIAEPLGMGYVGFDGAEGSSTMTARTSSNDDENGKLVPMPPGAGFHLQHGTHTQSMYGGSSGWATPAGFLRLMRALLPGGGGAEGSKVVVLGREMVDEMFRPQLVGNSGWEDSKTEINRETRVPGFGTDVLAACWSTGTTGEEDGQDFDHGLGGIMGMRDEAGRRRAGTMSWCGGCNVYWWVDRETGLCGGYFSQLMPPGDAETLRMEEVFERSVYEKYAEFRAGK